MCLTVNGEVTREAQVSDLSWNCAEQIDYFSRLEKLLPGDLIYTGTPAGVGAVKPGNIGEVTIVGLTSHTVSTGEKEAEYT